MREGSGATTHAPQRATPSATPIAPPPQRQRGAA
jgi:hypothetical protein